MENIFEIKLTDLKPEVQKELAEFIGIKDFDKGNIENYDVFPIAFVEKPEVEEEA